MFDIDAAMADLGSSDSGSQSLPDATAPAPSQNAGQPTASSGYDPNQLVTYKASGKDLSEPLSTVIQRAQRGYDYAQLVQQHKQREAELQAQQQRIAEMESQWKPYHEFASQNPEWANHVRDLWDKRYSATAPMQTPDQGMMQQGAQQSNFNLPPEIAQKISKMEEFISMQEQNAQAAQRASEDAALASEIQSIRSVYPDIDFSHTNPETGESLEAQILRHAQENRIYNFKAAFKDFYFDKLQERAVMKAKEDATKTMTAQHKQGFLATSSQPLLQNNGNPTNLKTTSYHQLMDLAAKEFGLS
jgi:hypothetical protein